MQDLLNVGALNVNPTSIIAVNSIDDVPSADGVTTLRDAINQANSDAGEDLIVFERSLFSSQQTINLNLGELDITHNLDIIAPSDSLTGNDLLTISGNKAARVFEIEAGATVSLNGLIVADGLVTNSNGGGIKNSGILTLDNSIVHNNSPTSSSLSTSVFTDNNGGGIYNSGTINIRNSTISDNLIGGYSSSGGAGIYNSGTVFLSNSTVSGNSVRGYTNIGNGGGGGGIYNSGTVVLSNSTLSRNSVSSYAVSGGGGGIYNSNGTVVLSNSTLSRNSVISDNLDGGGGGIYNKGGRVEVSNSTLTGNSTNSKASEGGGIFNSGSLEVSNSTLRGDLAEGTYTSAGGSIYTERGGLVVVSNSDILNNGAVNGGGIYNNSSTIMISNTTLSANSAQGGRYGGNVGGGIYNGGTLTLNNSTLSGNTATLSSPIIGGPAYPLGGGILNDGTLTLNNSTLNRNSSYYGGGIFNSGSLTLLFSTLTENQATNGSGVYQRNSSFSSPFTTSVRNTIIASNLLDRDGINRDVSGDFISNGYNLIGDSTGSTGFGVTGDIVGTSDNPIDPRLDALGFNGGSTKTLALLPDSPAIGAADPTVLDTDPTNDQRGLPRRATDGSADIGAYEFS